LHKLDRENEVELMKEARNRAQTLLSAADFPGEILTGVPVIEVKGMAEAVVLNHRGLIGYESSAIRIASAIGPVRISGEALTVFRMNRERIVVQGRIRRVELGPEP
jgi:sporulation protein YqfC